jgi:hypothetical protein
VNGPGRALLAALAAVAVPAAVAQPQSDWEVQQAERNWREGEVVLPAYPKADDLIEFDVGPATPFRFFIDPASLSVGGDGVIRYAQVARSGAGAENISYEGIRCRPATTRTYAFGRRDGRWASTMSAWRTIDQGVAQGSAFALWRRYLCPHGIAIRDRDEGIAALRSGGHPDAPRDTAFGR